MLFRKLSILLMLAIFTTGLHAQTKPPSNEAEFEAAYNKRIKKEYLKGVYIPKDLADAFIALNRLTEDASKAKYKSMPEAVAVTKLHFSLGRWMIQNWGFYEGSRLSHYLKELGIHHPDDMARFIMLSYHRNLNKNKLDVKTQIEQIKEMRKRKHEEKMNEGELLHEEKRIRQKN